LSLQLLSWHDALLTSSEAPHAQRIFRNWQRAGFRKHSSRMRVLVAPDKFKGSLTSVEAARAIKRGLHKTWPDADVREMPIADGGEGTAEAIRAATGGESIDLRVHDALGEIVEARYAWIAGDTAVIEMSQASGLWRIAPGKRDPLRASTFGTGEMIADAARRGAKKIIAGIGGSATNDGGAGMAAALGYRFLTSDGDPIEPVPANLLALERIKPPEHLTLPEIVAACDVRNPLLGERGASRTYGAQKGADAAMIETLDRALENLADVCAQELGCDFRDTPGAGAAGGLGFGLLTFCHAQIRSGFEVVAEILNLENAIADSDLVITGEGRLDSQTLEGKGPAGVATFARKHGKPVVAFAGSVADDAALAKIFAAAHAIKTGAITLEEAVANAAFLLEQAAERFAESWTAAGELARRPLK
jgi:glycerate 2-kinase